VKAIMMSLVLLSRGSGLGEVIAVFGAVQEYCSDSNVGQTIFQNGNTAS
jgi:hypothetical protein